MIDIYTIYATRIRKIRDKCTLHKLSLRLVSKIPQGCFDWQNSRKIARVDKRKSRTVELQDTGSANTARPHAPFHTSVAYNIAKSLDSTDKRVHLTNATAGVQRVANPIADVMDSKLLHINAWSCVG